MKRIILLLIIALLIFPLASAWEPTENTKFVTVWDGAKPITDSLSLKSASQQASILKTATYTEMQKQTYPYDVEKKVESTTTFKILSFSCDRKKFGIDADICGYWVAAYRDGKTVATNSPVLISPPPIRAIVSEVYDQKNDIMTITFKEDVKLATEQVLQWYVDEQPPGKPIIGTPV